MKSFLKLNIHPRLITDTLLMLVRKLDGSFVTFSFSLTFLMISSLEIVVSMCSSIILVLVSQFAMSCTCTLYYLVRTMPHLPHQLSNSMEHGIFHCICIIWKKVFWLSRDDGWLRCLWCFMSSGKLYSCPHINTNQTEALSQFFKKLIREVQLMRRIKWQPGKSSNVYVDVIPANY